MARRIRRSKRRKTGKKKAVRYVLVRAFATVSPPKGKKRRTKRKTSARHTTLASVLRRGRRARKGASVLRRGRRARKGTKSKRSRSLLKYL